MDAELNFDISKLEITTRALNLMENVIPAFCPEFKDMDIKEQAAVKCFLLENLMKENEEIKNLIGKEFLEQLKIWFKDKQ